MTIDLTVGKRAYKGYWNGKVYTGYDGKKSVYIGGKKSTAAGLIQALEAGEGKAARKSTGETICEPCMVRDNDGQPSKWNGKIYTAAEPSKCRVFLSHPSISKGLEFTIERSKINDMISCQTKNPDLVYTGKKVGSGSVKEFKPHYGECSCCGQYEWIVDYETQRGWRGKICRNCV